jgi:hypothetical protein
MIICPTPAWLFTPMIGAGAEMNATPGVSTKAVVIARRPLDAMVDEQETGRLNGGPLSERPSLSAIDSMGDDLPSPGNTREQRAKINHAKSV